MASIAVIAEPLGTPAALAAIDRLRRRFDPRHGVVPAHVTLVFPVAADPDAAARALAAVAASGAVAGRLGRAETIRTGRRSWYVVLPVTTGAGRVARLHHRLSQGPFAGNRRGTAPYRPHLTVAAALDAAQARRARRLALPLAGIRLMLPDLALVAWDGRRLEERARRRLGPGAAAERVATTRPFVRPSTARCAARSG